MFLFCCLVQPRIPLGPPLPRFFVFPLLFRVLCFYMRVGASIAERNRVVSLWRVVAMRRRGEEKKNDSSKKKKNKGILAMILGQHHHRHHHHHHHHHPHHHHPHHYHFVAESFSPSSCCAPRNKGHPRMKRYQLQRLLKTLTNMRCLPCFFCNGRHTIQSSPAWTIHALCTAAAQYVQGRQSGLQTFPFFSC